MRVSLVIPVYNGEKLLRETLASVERQTFSDFECICVNDGGGDHSLDIIGEFARRDARFVVVDKSNEGVATTRNRGIECARGEFLSFLDQDDTLSKDYLRQLVAMADATGADVVCAAIDKDDFVMPEPGTYDFRRFMRGVHDPGGVDVNVWAKLYRLSTIGAARCPDGLYGADDYVFSARYFKERARRLAVCPEAVYGHRMHSGSITSRMPAEFVVGTLEAEIMIMDLLAETPDCYQREFSRVAAWGVKKVLRNGYSREEIGRISDRIRTVIGHPAFASAKFKDRMRLRLAAAGRYFALRVLSPSLIWRRRCRRS